MKFLKQLNDIINSKSFNPKKDFFFKNRKNDLDNSLYTNLSTLLLIGYDNNDVINEIKILKYEEYYETIIDVVGNEGLLYVFKRLIQGYLIYIKLSIRNNKIIVCYSFHISDETKNDRKREN